MDKKKKILVVDDEVDLREILKEGLRPAVMKLL